MKEKLVPILIKTYSQLTYQEKDFLIKVLQNETPSKYIQMIEHFVKFPDHRVVIIIDYFVSN